MMIQIIMVIMMVENKGNGREEASQVPVYTKENNFILNLFSLLY